MPRSAQTIIIIIVGVLIISAFILSMTWAVIGITRVANGYYVIGEQIAVLADNNLMTGDRTGSFSKDELVFFGDFYVDNLSQNDVIIYSSDDGINVKRIRYILIEEKSVNIYASTDANYHNDLELVSKESILGIYSHSSVALGGLARFSTQFSGVLVLHVLPSIALIGYTLALIFFLKKRLQ